MYILEINEQKICYIDTMYELMVTYPDNTKGMRLQLIKHMATSDDIINYPGFNFEDFTITSIALLKEEKRNDDEDSTYYTYWSSTDYKYLTKMMITYFANGVNEESQKIVFEFDKVQK